MEDIEVSKKYYWIIEKKYYEVSKETYQKFKSEYDHSKKLKEYKDEVTVLSLDALTIGARSFGEIVADSSVNLEDEVVQKILIENMQRARETLSADDKLLLTLFYDQNKSQDEVSQITGIAQSTISYRLDKILKKLRKIMGIKK